MPDEEAAEWLGVIERQQLEIEALRQELETATSRDGVGWPSPPHCSLPRRGSNASVSSSVASVAISVLSIKDSASELPMDSERYAKICEKMEQMRASMARKDARLLKARAKASEAQKESAHLREIAANLRSEVEAQRAQMMREKAASQETIEKAVEKAAHAIVKNNLLRAELRKLKAVEVRLNADLEARGLEVQSVESTRDGLQSELQRAQKELVQLANNVGVLQREKDILQEEFHRAQQELEGKRNNDYAWEAMDMQAKALQKRIGELESFVHQQSTQLEQQARHVEKQHEQIHRLEQEHSATEQDAAIDRAESQEHAAHLLKINISLQHDLEGEQTRSYKLTERVGELRETTQLLGEELLQTKAEILRRDRVLTQRGEKYAALGSAYRRLERHTQTLEISERELISILVPTKKRLALLQDTLTRFCCELEGVSRQMMTSRNRELSLGRALREYGKRNRELQASVVSARQQLQNVVNAFRSSEKRKEQAISANWNLKRDLVVERCQRTDLLHQCKELEGCLDSCQSSAFESQTRAEGLENDNGVLQHAVTQLVAYAQELMSSQQSLQKELSKLEVTGKRQPAVYG